MLPGKITSVGHVFLCRTVATPLHRSGLSRLSTSPPLQGPSVSLPCRCPISCCGATGHHLLPETPPMACTSSLYIPDILCLHPYSITQIFLLFFLPSQLSPRQCRNVGHCLSHMSDHIQNLGETSQISTNISCLPWTNVHYPHTGLSVD